MPSPVSTRKGISAAPARAVTGPERGGRPRTPSAPNAGQPGVVATFGGFTLEELETLSPDIAANSLGCGNPVVYGEFEQGQTVLVLGSAACADLLLVAQRVGLLGHVIGVEMTDESLARVAGDARLRERREIEVRKGTIEQLPVEDGTVDWVLANRVLVPSQNKARAFREIARVLEPGGQTLVSDIVASELTPEFRANPALCFSWLSEAVSLESFVNGLREAGLEEVRVVGRLAYDATQIETFFRSELPGQPSPAAAYQAIDPQRLEAAARSMVGKLESVRLYAQKPR